jgi:hypothetical protein
MPELISGESYIVKKETVQIGEKHFPSIRIEFKDPKSDPKRYNRVPPGYDGYDTCGKAQAASDNVTVEYVYNNGLVVFTPPGK